MAQGYQAPRNASTASGDTSEQLSQRMARLNFEDSPIPDFTSSGRITAAMQNFRDRLVRTLEGYMSEDGLKKEICETVEDADGGKVTIRINDIKNPLNTFWNAHKDYMKIAPKKTKILFVGMNPSRCSPMGIPFFSNEGHSEFLRSKGIVIDDDRSSESGRRFWKFIVSKIRVDGEQLMETYKRIFDNCFVINFCPLYFLDILGHNISLDRFDKSNHPLLKDIFENCAHALKTIIEHFQPDVIVGVGSFARNRVHDVTTILHVHMFHPSPKHYATYEDWVHEAEAIDTEDWYWLNLKIAEITYKDELIKEGIFDEEEYE